tara:strand:- start:592 stop:840 length:249 start_codon:yes stop_codon:yes gene_type:complete
MNEENYGTEVSIEELKGHYETHFLTAEQFIDLVKKWHKSEVKKLTLNDVAKPFYCYSENATGLRCGTQCSGCDVIEINKKLT